MEEELGREQNQSPVQTLRASLCEPQLNKINRRVNCPLSSAADLRFAQHYTNRTASVKDFAALQRQGAGEARANLCSANSWEKGGKTRLQLTLAFVCAVGSGRLPRELVEARAAAIAGPAAGVVLAVALQPAGGEERGSAEPGAPTGACGTGTRRRAPLCVAVTSQIHQ